MIPDRTNDLRAFWDFADAKLSNGDGDFSLDEDLADLEIDNQSDQDREDTLRAIRRGHADMDAGQTMDAFEFTRRIRQEIRSAAKP